MSRFRVAQQLVVDCARGATAVWLTTADAARMLQVSANGVRWLVETKELPCTWTPSGRRLLHRRDVLELVERRARRRILTRQEVWRSLRIVRGAREPRQLALPLFGATVRRKVTGGSSSETSPIVEGADVGLISGPMLPAKVDGRKRMAKMEEPHHERHTRRAGDARR